MEPVYFDTNFIFRFGNEGIVSFGGEEDNIIDTCTVTWRHSDILIANSALHRMKEEMHLPDPQISSYSKNKEGTNNLIANLVSRGGIPNEYLLGCAICHQLQYQVPLEATFLSGCPNSDSDSCNNETPYFETGDSSECNSE